MNNSGICIDFSLHFLSCVLFLDLILQKKDFHYQISWVYIKLGTMEEDTEWTLLHKTNVANLLHTL